MRLFDTPMKRIGLCLIAGGALGLAYGWWTAGRTTEYLACLIDLSTRRGCSPLRWGTWLVVAGIALPPLAAWIFNGRAQRSR